MTSPKRWMDADWYPIDSAPRDGTEIWVQHDDCGAFPMRWKPDGFNPLVSTDGGLWEAPGGGFTWTEEDSMGPSHWRPTDQADAQARMQ